MKYFRTIVLLVTVASIAACSRTKSETTENSQQNKATLDTISISAPKNLKPKIPLTLKATAATENWTFYKELSLAIESLGATTLKELSVKLQQFNTIYEVSEETSENEVSTSPEEINTKAINARLLAIKTRIDALQNEADLNRPNITQLSIKIGELKNAYQDLNLQLNEVYNTSVKDLLEEIKAENKKEQINNSPTTLLDNQQELK